jgi:Ca2+-binding EF-hand superfamily protein
MTALRLPLALTAALLALSAASAHAAPHEHSAFITDYDIDKDGKVTAAEFKTIRDQRFAAMDVNKDGFVDEAEYVAEYQARLTAQLAASTEPAERKAEQEVRQIRQAHVRFGVLDTDKDNRISADEFTASGARAFAEQDGDGDGVVSAGEKKKGE